MFSLVPVWAINYEQFWNSVNCRNLWFIKLRYAAVLMLVALIMGTKYVLTIKLSTTQLNATISITFLIFLYNIVIHLIKNKIKPINEGINNLHLSVIQMVLDLIALTLLIYFLGSLENPMYMFYIFHMIIGSLILPGSLIYTIAFTIVIVFSALIILEYYGVLYHHSINGLLAAPIYQDSEYIIIFISVFVIMMFMSVVLANKIAKELYKREHDLFETLKKLDEAEKIKQKYTMGVVHELKTPIAAVKSYLELILKNYVGPIEKDVSEKLERAKVRAEEAIDLANEVLQISRLRLQENINREEIDIFIFLSDIICRYKSTAELKNIELKLNDMRNKNLKYMGDKVLLELAFSNLIGNAVKYNLNNGSIEVNIKEIKGNLIIEICDDGIGIPQNELQKIFLEFYRASNIKHKGLEGTGMGLSIVQHIIDNHHGIIKVESPSKLQKDNRPGTCFIIYLPIDN